MKKCVLKTDNDLNYTSEVFCNKKSKSEFAIIYFITLVLVVCFFSICFIEVDDTVRAFGILTTEENISLVKNQISGKVEKIHFVPGDYVTKNDLLFQIDVEDLELKLENLNLLYSKIVEEENSYRILNNLIEEDGKYSICTKDNFASIQYQTYKKTIDKLEKKVVMSKNEYYDEATKPAGFTTKNKIRDKKVLYEYALCELNEYKLNYKNNLINKLKDLERQNIEYKGNILILENDIKKSKVYSPISGFVQEIKKFNVGEVLQPMEEILKIIPSADKTFKAELQIPAKDAGKVFEGASVKLRFPAYPFYEYKGITSMIQIFEEDSNNISNGLYYKIICDLKESELENKKGEKKYLRSGLEVDGRIVVERDTILNLMLRKLKIDL